MKLNNVFLYRITHIDNIPHILENGITHKNSTNKNVDFKNIGNVSLIETRNNKTILVDNGVFDSSNAISIVLSEYTPFYFGVRMPMLYVAQHGGNFVKKATPPEKIVYIACSLNSIISSGHTYYFTNGHALDNLTTFYDKSKIEELVEIIDWTAIKSRYWSGDENLNLKRKKQAEFLISGDISSKHIIGIGCYNSNAKNRLLLMGISEEIIKIIHNAYF